MSTGWLGREQRLCQMAADTESWFLGCWGLASQVVNTILPGCGNVVRCQRRSGSHQMRSCLSEHRPLLPSLPQTGEVRLHTLSGLKDRPVCAAPVRW